MTDEHADDPEPVLFVQAVSFSPDLETLVGGGRGGGLALYDVESGRRLRVLLDPEGIDDAELEPRVTVGGEEADVGFRLERLSECMRGTSIMTLCFSSDGKRLAVGAGNGTVVIWNVESWGEIHSWQPHESAITALAISPDGRWLATGCGETGADTLRVWRRDGPHGLPGNEAFSSDRMIGGVFALDVSPDSRYVASGGWGFSGYSAPMLYELETGERVNSLPFDASRAIAYSPDGTLLATGGEYGTVSLWDLATRQQIVKKEETHGRIVSVVTFSPDGRRLVSGSLDGGLKIWAVDGGELLEHHTLDGFVLAAGFSHDGDTLHVAAAARDADRLLTRRFGQGVPLG